MAWAIFDGCVEESDKRADTANGGSRSTLRKDFLVFLSAVNFLNSDAFSKVLKAFSSGMHASTTYFGPKDMSGCSKRIGDAVAPAPLNATIFSFILAVLFFKKFPNFVGW